MILLQNMKGSNFLLTLSYGAFYSSCFIYISLLPEAFLQASGLSKLPPIPAKFKKKIKDQEEYGRKHTLRVLFLFV